MMLGPSPSASVRGGTLAQHAPATVVVAREPVTSTVRRVANVAPVEKRVTGSVVEAIDVVKLLHRPASPAKRVTVLSAPSMSVAPEFMPPPRVTAPVVVSTTRSRGPSPT